MAAVQDERADLLAQLGATRLSGHDDLAPVRLEPLGEKTNLRRLPRTVEPFECHKHRAQP